jgi:CelD/BcsL family acetyltransferase involved in cellulose biosynthesis
MDVSAALPDWASVAKRSGNVFATPEWLLAWWRHLGRGEPQIWIARDDEGPKVLLPLFLDRGVLRFIGHWHSDVLGPVAAPELRETAAALMRNLLESDEIAWKRFEGRDMPGDLPWTRLLGAKETGRMASPVLRLEGLDWDGYLTSRSRNFRAQVRAAERRLSAFGGRVRVCEDPSQLQRDLGDLFELHLARWGKARARELIDRGAAFYTEVAGTFLELGWLHLLLLELEGRPAAALLNFRFGGEEWFYQGGRDPAFDRESPGFMLHVHAIRTAIEDGLLAYRFLRGPEPYKYRFTSEDAGVVSVAINRKG